MAYLLGWTDDLLSWYDLDGKAGTMRMPQSITEVVRKNEECVAVLAGDALFEADLYHWTLTPLISRVAHIACFENCIFAQIGAQILSFDASLTLRLVSNTAPDCDALYVRMSGLFFLQRRTMELTHETWHGIRSICEQVCDKYAQVVMHNLLGESLVVVCRNGLMRGGSQMPIAWPVSEKYELPFALDGELYLVRNGAVTKLITIDTRWLESEEEWTGFASVTSVAAFGGFIYFPDGRTMTRRALVDSEGQVVTEPVSTEAEGLLRAFPHKKLSLLEDHLA